MNQRLSDALTKVRTTWSTFTAGQRVVTVIALVVALVGGVAFFQWASRPTMTPVFTSLTSQDAGAITAKLDELGTPYELADGGSTVEVPAEQVAKTRIDLAAAGLPAQTENSQGYGLLDQQNFASSDFQQKMAAKRAAEGELQKAIDSLDAVQKSTVQLALPDEEVFTAAQTPTTASVLVTPKPQQQLDTGQVEAIVHLVSSAVPKLVANNVTVTDSTGRLLSATGAAGAASAIGDQRLAQAQGLSASAQQKIQAMLDKAVGPGASSVTVTADLNFDDTKIQANEYIPAQPGAVPVQEDTETEKLRGNGQTPTGGVLGPDNITVPQGNSGQSNQQYDTEKRKTINPVGTRTTVTEQAPGRLARMTVAVMLDANKSAALNQTEMNQLVAAAAGIDATRGDVVKVSRVPFDTQASAAAEAEARAAAEQERQNQLVELAKNIGLALLLLLALLIGFRKSRKKTKTVEIGDLTSYDAEPLPSAGGSTAVPMQELPPAPAEYALEDDEMPVIEATPIDPQSEARTQARAEITALVDENPDEVARLLRGWITERN
ncbi:flagellar basal-body MS-ring/collar protein FliF [Mobilicoccus pelagius]|uniref:Flagellar M-ring protein n=1 Tax=Mobilicoccus pelagius NBRC 104925 TaxID=1089455 RepID=H5UP70_9MICO|nr:flagellar basal-body MS-ring/collar protein FliF [Mobilicoccus pelagius]GAB47528.1 flagellar M-ring protein [Mobilicoccus pelagius NBRC 104925]